MKWQPYPKYKDSGVEWLGAVPEHWKIGPLKRFVMQRPGAIKTGPFGSQLTSAEMQEGVVKVYNQRSVIDGDFSAGENYISEQQFSLLKAFETFPGDLLVTTRGTIGRAAVLPLDAEQGILHPCLLRVQVDPSVLMARYLQFLVQDSHLLRTQLDLASNATTIEVIYSETMNNLLLAIPPLPEMEHLAGFLDRETAKIDTLIAKQERLIELLQEKRQALIDHAVTKGLNPDAPMKPSGVEWLGDVPAHWKVMTLKNFSTLQRGHDLTDAERTEGLYPVVTSGGISGTHGSFMAHGPGVVTGRYGSTGRLFYIESDFWPHNTSLYVVDFHGNDPRFVWYSLQTVDFAAHSAKAAVPGIDRNDIHVLPVTVPPKDEQPAIVCYLDLVTAKIDALTARAERAVVLLQERRTALISAAVTGKIDVREPAYA